MRITLTVTAGPHEGKQFAFGDHDVFLVGRDPQAHFRLPREDRYFSRRHFLIEFNPPCCRLQDLGSRNGTYVNGAHVERTDLRDSDLIRGGRTELRVAVEGAAADPATATLAAPLRPAVDDPYATQAQMALPQLQPDASGLLTAVCPVCGRPASEAPAPPSAPTAGPSPASCRSRSPVTGSSASWAAAAWASSTWRRARPTAWPGRCSATATAGQCTRCPRAGRSCGR
jgi:predicted component of type VI protein secretion system